jgi:hypothetical protein
VTNESTERRFAYYDDYFRSLQNGGWSDKRIIELSVYKALCAQKDITDEIIEELTIASKKLESSGAVLEDLNEHIIKYTALIAELDKLLKKK